MTVNHEAVSTTPLLDQVDVPADLRALKETQLRQFADELRQDLIETVAVTGGHLGASLGVIELTVALHYLFDTPNDRLIWDVSHQCYPHKIITGRRDEMRTIRQPGGLSGFTKRTESEYDPFGAAHSSTSISAALGMAVARTLNDEAGRMIAVIGDGAMSAGMAYEALNNAGARGEKVIVILNDNEMSIAPPSGALSNFLSRTTSSHAFAKIDEIGAQLAKAVSKTTIALKQAPQGERHGGEWFEELGFNYVGPVDGHDIDSLVAALKCVRDEAKGPVLVHVKTEKGKGYAPAEASKDKYHGVSKFNVATGVQATAPAGAPSYTKVFAQSLIEEARIDSSIVAVTAAMPDGTGLDLFAKEFPDRTFDVGIAEQHAVTFAAGLACEGMKPFAAIYSTFLQRGYDQVVHDVAIQKLPVRFAIDRAGFVGADGSTHAGTFDVAYLSCLPGMVVMAAADESELKRMVATAASIDDRPSAFRYPRGEGIGINLPPAGWPLEIGKGRVVREGTAVAILSFGTRLQECLKAADKLAAFGLPATVADARFAKPLDEQLIRQLARHHDVLITVEEGSVGGFGSHVMQFLAMNGLMDRGLRVRPLVMPDTFVEQGKPEAMYEAAGLNASGIVRAIFQALGDNRLDRRYAEALRS